MISENVQKIVLPNGVRILLEKLPYVRSASIGLWIDVGSRNELPFENGISHFIEHMLFKGTSKYNALQVSQEINKVGGNVNAFTTQEHICLSSKVIDEHLERTFSLLFDMYSDSIFDSVELGRERGVILEEIKMYEDLPDELVIDEFIQNIYPNNPLGQPIIGNVTNVNDFKSDLMKKFIAREFSPDRLVISIVGNFDTDSLIAFLTNKLDKLEKNPSSTQQNPLVSPDEISQSKVFDKKLRQVHFCFGGYGPNRASKDRFAFYVLNTILGSGSSSRIFQEVREKRGLAYSIGTFDIAFKDSGCIAVVGGCTPKNLSKVIDISLSEIKKSYTELVTDDELLSAKEQLKTGILLGMENSSSRMSRMSEYELYFGEYTSFDDTLNAIKNVTAAEVLEVAEKYLKDKDVSFTGIGPEKNLAPYKDGVRF